VLATFQLVLVKPRHHSLLKMFLVMTLDRLDLHIFITKIMYILYSIHLLTLYRFFWFLFCFCFSCFYMYWKKDTILYLSYYKYNQCKQHPVTDNIAQIDVFMYNSCYRSMSVCVTRFATLIEAMIKKHIHTIHKALSEYQLLLCLATNTTVLLLDKTSDANLIGWLL